MEKLLEMVLAVQARITSARDDHRGATATEYAVLVAVIALILILGASFFGSQLESFFSKLGSKVQTWANAIT